ncbi:glycerophosphoryl diester phosphodiesterase [Arthrobacter ulcerisalmonis]|uniref:glycerophosphodiester phosphodiesterase family protein n=1 Tax=Arthrobacter sp. B1I2 TaxID=3042263 RepID=UPI0027884E55|nr:MULTISPECIES: glycerophosphodiester phosphodiesterase family protein [Arthrobacter]MDQ0662105.1 glycerophosphoryl diester phosphodiesterase [Arthrobacter ulcerisalmonis]MDQ0730030.1 glycerophosphoryl diester phosphodiesterase [Arthrobacter sp. B1I2]
MTLPFFEHPDDDGLQLPIAMAHRGFSAEGLENSMAAFRAAVELGFRYLETDVHTTADGVLLLFHDQTLDRVTDGRGRVADLPATDVAKARINGREPIPTFDELVTRLPGVRLNLDVKDWSSVHSTAAAIERHQVHQQVLVTSFSDRRRRAVLKLLSRPVASSAGVASSALFTLLGPVLPRPVFRRLMRRVLRDVHALQVPVRYGRVPVVTPGFIGRAHDLGLVVHVWTINDADEMHGLLQQGVDGIVTDRADLLRDVLIERGEWPEGHPPRPGS